MNLSKEAKKSIKNVAIYNLILVIPLNIGFMLLGNWDITVLYGSLFGYLISMFNFISLAFSVEKAVDMETKKSQVYMNGTYAGRMILVGALIVFGFKVSIFNWVSVVIPLIFTRISMMLMAFFKKED